MIPSRDGEETGAVQNSFHRLIEQQQAKAAETQSTSPLHLIYQGIAS
jgi:hypothetical protein